MTNDSRFITLYAAAIQGLCARTGVPYELIADEAYEIAETSYKQLIQPTS